MKRRNINRNFLVVATVLIFTLLLLSSCKAGKTVAGKATSADFGGFSLTEAGRAFDVNEIILGALNAGKNIEGVQTCASAGITPGNHPPSLQIADNPSGTQSLVLLMEDLGPVDNPFSLPLVHWVVWDIPVTGGNLDVSAGITGNNEVTPSPSSAPSIDYDNVYTGPCPDTTGYGDLENHKYIFTAYALSVATLDLDVESSASDVRSRILEVTGAESLDVVPHVVLTAWYPANPTARVSEVTDTDGDGVADSVDECPDTLSGVATDNGCSLEQVDPDLDNVCTTPKRYSYWCSNGISDNCPTVANPDQTDTDGDGVGDACEQISVVSNVPPDSDSDGVLNEVDNCPTVKNGVHDSLATCNNDLNADGKIDENEKVYCNQHDGDNDGVGSLCDNCPGNYNPLQLDTDGDGLGSDAPGRSCDICPDVADPEQLDTNGDGQGDACEPPAAQPTALAKVNFIDNYALMVILDASASTDPQDCPTGFDAQSPADCYLVYAWDFNGDGIFESSGRTASYVFATPGKKSVVLQVYGTNAEGNIDRVNEVGETTLEVTVERASTRDTFLSELINQLDTESEVQTNKEKVKDLFRKFLRGLTEH